LTGDSRAVAALRSVAVVLLPLTVIPTGLLFWDLRGTLSRLLGDRQIYLALALLMAGGTVVPLTLLLSGEGAPWSLGAVALIVLGNLAIRILILKIPHTSHESRSA